MKDIKLIYNRFDESIEVGKLVIDAEMNYKKVQDGAKKVESSLNDVTKSVDGAITSLDKFKNSGSGSFTGLQKTLKSLISNSKELDKLMSNMSRQKSVTTGFKGEISSQKNKEILSKNKIGFTGGETTDTTQLKKETELVYKNIQDKIKVINDESRKRVQIAQEELKSAQQIVTQYEKEVSAKQKASDKAAKQEELRLAKEASEEAKKKVQAEKEAAKQAREYAKEQEKAAKEAAKLQAEKDRQDTIQKFTTSFTTIEGSDTASLSFLQQYNAILNSLDNTKVRDSVVTKLMTQEEKAQTNAIVQKINALKQEITASTKTVSTMDKLKNAMEKVNNATNKAKTKFSEFTAHLQSIAVRWRILSSVASSIVNTFANIFENAAAYEESLNLYRVALGEYADEATEWGNRISDALYLDPKDVMQYTGALYNLVQGLGASSDAAYLMSTNLTQLAYDMSSYLNIDVESAYEKLQSAITGQSRAVASAGIAMQQASLQELAYTLGIKKNVSTMTQAEKTYLRYIQIMRSTTNMQGDLARTIITPENALRLVKNQFNLLSRAIGQVFIPIVLKAIPYVMALTRALQRLASFLSKKTGYEIADIDYSQLKTLDMYSDSIESIGDSASGTADKIKNSLAPFDDLNVVASESSGSGTGSGTTGSILPQLEEYLTGYDMLEGLTSEFENQIDEAEGKLKKLIPIVEVIGAGLLTWKIAKSFMNGVILVDKFITSIGKLKGLSVVSKFGSSISKLIPNLGKFSVKAGAAVAIIALLVEGFKNAYEKSGEFRNKLDKLKQSFNNMMEPISNFIYDFKYSMSNLFDSILPVISEGFKKYKDTLMKYLEIFESDFIDKFTVGFETLGNLFNGDFAAIFDDFGTFIQDKIDGIADAWDDLVNLDFSGFIEHIPVINDLKEAIFGVNTAIEKTPSEYSKAMDAITEYNSNLDKNAEKFDLVSFAMNRKVEKGEDLLEQLYSMVDENGNVIESEDKVRDKINEINAVLGTNMTVVDGTIVKDGEKISSLQDLQDEMDNYIHKLKATTLVEAYKDTYVESIKFINENTKKRIELEDKLREGLEKYNVKIVDGKIVQDKNYDAFVKQYGSEIKAYQALTNGLIESQLEVDKYEKASMEIASGHYESAEKTITKTTKDITIGFNEVFGMLQRNTIENEEKFVHSMVNMNKEAHVEIKDNYNQFFNDTTTITGKVNEEISQIGKEPVTIKSNKDSFIKEMDNVFSYFHNKDIKLKFNPDTTTLTSNLKTSITTAFSSVSSKIGIDFGKIFGIKQYASGGFPTSGDLFFANENGRAEYITSVGNKSAVANQDQMVGALANAITNAIGSIGINNQPGVTQVYIGNEKVYEGQGTYQNRQSDRYGTTYINI